MFWQKEYLVEDVCKGKDPGKYVRREKHLWRWTTYFLAVNWQWNLWTCHFWPMCSLSSWSICNACIVAEQHGLARKTYYLTSQHDVTTFQAQNISDLVQRKHFEI